MKKLIKDAQDEAKGILYLELYRLNRYRFALSPNQSNPRVVDTLLRILDREARLLGLYPSRKVEICVPNQAPIQAREKALDLSKLNLEELLRLEALYKKAAWMSLKWGGSWWARLLRMRRMKRAQHR
jgi:hypothetical protein